MPWPEALRLIGGAVLPGDRPHAALFDDRNDVARCDLAREVGHGHPRIEKVEVERCHAVPTAQFSLEKGDLFGAVHSFHMKTNRCCHVGSGPRARPGFNLAEEEAGAQSPLDRRGALL